MLKKRYVVEFTKFASKQILKLPRSVQEAVYFWVESINQSGMMETRLIKGLHDEPLKGKRRGQRSVRLNRSYRLIYEMTQKGEIVVVGVLEVNKHEY